MLLVSSCVDWSTSPGSDGPKRSSKSFGDDEGRGIRERVQLGEECLHPVVLQVPSDPFEVGLDDEAVAVGRSGAGGAEHAGARMARQSSTEGRLRTTGA